MKFSHILICGSIGFLAAAILVVLTFLLELTSPDVTLFGQLVLGAGDKLYPFVLKSGLLRGGGEGAHYAFVFLFPLVLWWLVFAFVACAWRRSKQA